MPAGFQVGPFQPAYQQVPLAVGVVPVTSGGGGGRVWYQGKRRKRRLIDRPNLHLETILDSVVHELYGELTDDDVSPEIQAKAAKLVKPFVDGKDKKVAVPEPEAVDWTRLERDATRVQALIALWRKQEIQREIDDEDDFLMMVD